jgi:hypothetical protein
MHPIRRRNVAPQRKHLASVPAIAARLQTGFATAVRLVLAGRAWLYGILPAILAHASLS